jgi:RecA/RadA recombinase
MTIKIEQFNSLFHKVPTPSVTINLAGGGGLEFGGMVELWGESRSGKSTFAYESAKMFLDKYGENAVVIIMTSEGMPNKIRLKRAFGLDLDNDSRIWYFPAFTYEDANTTIIKNLKECKEAGKFVMVVYDSIMASTFKKAYEAIQEATVGDEKNPDGKETERNANEPMAKAAVLKWMLNNVMAELYNYPAFVYLINQVTSKTTQFNVTQSSAGGFALKHNCNERFKFVFKGKIGGARDEKGKIVDKSAIAFDGTETNLTVEKSRNIPSFFDIELVINDKVGGKFMPNIEVYKIADKLGLIDKISGGYYAIEKEMALTPKMIKAAKLPKSKGKDDFISNKEIMEALEEGVLNLLRSNYSSVQWTYEAIEAEGS